jgi:glycerol uptake facilitator-like aquaporin
MLLAEFVGTAVLTLSVINISRSQIGIGYFVAIGVGATLSLLVLAFAVTSGAHFNPAVTIGQWTIRKIGTIQSILYIAAQFLGAVVAWRLYEYFTGETLRSIAAKSPSWKVFWAEFAGTFIFTMLIAAALYQAQRGLRLAVTIGGGLFLGIIIATVASNGMLNPAVALGAQSWDRAYVLGPIFGSVVAMNIYALVFAEESVWTKAKLFSRTRRSKTVAVRPEPAKATSARSSSRSTAAKKPGRKPAARRTTTRSTTTARRTRR